MEGGEAEIGVRVSLIICSRNRPELLSETVEAVLAGDQVPDELIVVDQSDQRHPNLPAAEARRGCEIRYIWTRTRGLSPARNEGIAAARGEKVLFTDDDILPEPSWVRLMVGALREDGPRTVVTGQILPVEVKPGGFVPDVTVDETPAVYAGRVSVNVLAGGSMGMYRSVFGEVGRFDERFGAGTRYPSAEDLDFCYRLLEAGYRIRYLPEAILYHRAWRSDEEYLPLRWSYGLGRGGFYAKHLDPRDRYMLSRMAWDIINHLRGIPTRLRSDRRAALGNAVLILGILHGATHFLLTTRWRE